jgi:hypothetical protein
MTFKIFFLLTICLTTKIYSQSQFYNYVLESKFDTMTFNVKYDHYIDFENNKMRIKDYQYLEVDSFELVNDSDYKQHYRLTENNQPIYFYSLQNDTIYIDYFNNSINDYKKYPQFILKKSSLNQMIDINCLNSNSIRFRGKSNYVKDTILDMLGKSIHTYMFVIDDKHYASHSSHKKIELYIDKNKLIPVKQNITHYDFDTEKQKAFNESLYLRSITTELPNIKYYNDLNLYTDSNIVWTQNQIEFLKKEYFYDKINCYIKELNGKIPFYDFCVFLEYQNFKFTNSIYLIRETSELCD